jgi:hypothetical protein
MLEVAYTHRWSLGQVPVKGSKTIAHRIMLVTGGGRAMSQHSTRFDLPDPHRVSTVPSQILL